MVPFYGHLVSALCFLSLVNGSRRNDHWKSEYMEDYCDKKIDISVFEKLGLTHDIFYRQGWRCGVTLEAPKGHVVSIRFEKFDVGRSKLVTCDDVLRIYDGGSSQNSPEMTSTKGLCGQLLPTHFVSSSQKLTLRFKSRYITSSTGFTLAITSLRIADAEATSGACPGDDFRCMDNFCLDRTLVCDGVPNCIDKSDESTQHAGCQEISLDNVLCGAVVWIAASPILHRSVSHFSWKRSACHPLEGDSLVSSCRTTCTKPEVYRNYVHATICDTAAAMKFLRTKNIVTGGASGEEGGWGYLGVGARIAIFIGVIVLLIALCFTAIYCLCYPATGKRASVPYKKI